ncbi:MAG: aldo/keto reductase [Cellulomonadaceae bacterium]
MTAIPTYTLNDGTVVPAIGFGTYTLKGVSGVDAITSALDLGYRLLDSAYNYENEGTVGKAVRESGVPRSEILVTSKLPGRYQAYDDAITTVHESLYRTGLDYLDLYLIHWPNPKQGTYVEAWQALIDLKEQGLLRSIGVCNFLPEHLDRLEKATGVVPAVNQIELHPYFPQAEQRADDAARGIRTESWSPLGRASSVLEDPLIAQIADTHGVSNGQVILRWHTQLGSIPIPKSAHPQRQRENLEIFEFELAPDEIEAIGTLARPDGRIADQDPAVYEEF